MIIGIYEKLKIYYLFICYNPKDKHNISLLSHIFDSLVII